MDTHGVSSSIFFYFSIEQTPSCPEFIDLWVSNYYSSEGVIMDTSRSRMLCPINSLNVQNTLLVPFEFIHMSSEYTKQDILCSFQGSLDEQKDVFLKTCLKPESQL